MIGKRGPDPIDVHVGARIKSRRLLLCITQEKLAEGLGITFQQVQKYEKGTNRVGASRLQTIAVLLRVSVGYFFADTRQDNDGAEPHDEDAVIKFLSSREGVELNTAFTRLQEDRTRHSIVQLVKSLAENQAHSTSPSSDK